MAVPNVNQHYDCIVAKKWNGVKTKKADIEAGVTNPGDVIFFSTKNGEGRFIYRDNDTLKSSVLFNADVFSQYQGHTIDNTHTKYKRKTVVIKPKDNLFDGGTTQSADVAVVNLTFKNYLVVGDLNTYLKDGAVQMNPAMTKEEFLFSLAKSIVRSIKRDENLGVTVFIGTSTETGAESVVDMEAIDNAKTVADVTMTGADCIAIQETSMKWELGRFYNERPSFEVSTNLVEVGVAMPVEMAWAEDVNDYTFYDTNGIPNGRAVAEIEYFSQAQRGDKWLKGGWPYTDHAEGLVDPSKEYDVAVFNVTYRGDAEDIQYSPKQLYLVVPKDATAKLAAIIGQVKDYLG